MQGEVVRPGEGAVAFGAAEGFDSRVLAKVSRQLVGAGEAPGAAFPGAVVGLLSCRDESQSEQKGTGRRSNVLETNLGVIHYSSSRSAKALSLHDCRIKYR